jgi:hypothetical protein
MTDKINISNTVLWLLAGVALLTWAAMFSLGMAVKQPCDHTTPYQVPTVGGGTMLIVPEGWYAVPVLNEYGRPYMRPTDEEG